MTWHDSAFYDSVGVDTESWSSLLIEEEENEKKMKEQDKTERHETRRGVYMTASLSSSISWMQTDDGYIVHT